MTGPEKSEPVERPVAAAERTLRILNAFADTQRSLTLAELAAITGLFKSVILRYMVSFEKMSYVVKLDDGRYRLDNKAFQIGLAFESTFDRRAVIEASLTRLRDDSGESVFFYVRQADARMCLMGVDSVESLRVSRKIGVMIPMDETSISQVLRDHATGAPASMDDGLVRSSVGAYDPLTASISAPVFERGGALVGALSVSGPVGRFDAMDAGNRALVLAEARALSASLGFDGEA